MKMGKKVREYKSGDFIFAKVKGYPAWPARVQRLNGKKYFVYFYGTGETANLPPNMIFDYAENKDKFLTKTVKRKDFNLGVKQIEHDFANNVPVEEVVGTALLPEDTSVNDTINESAANDTMDESVATEDDIPAANDTTEDTNDTGVDDSDETGGLVIDEGKGRKSKAATPAKPVKEPKTPRGKAKKEEQKEEAEERKEEEIISRSGRKIRPKRYIDEHTEENTTLPSPAPKKRRGASPALEKEKEPEKEKPKPETTAKAKTDKMKLFNTVSQSELEDLKEPFAQEDADKENILIAYLSNGQYVGIRLFQSRPANFKNEAGRLQWDKQAATNALTLKMQLERGQITPQSVMGQLVTDLHLTDEEKATLDKERETEEKKSRVQFLKTEMKLIELDAKIKTCLCLEKADTELCLKLLDELMDLDVRPLMLLKHPSCLETVKRMRAYIGNAASWELSESAALRFNEQAQRIRKRADKLYTDMKELFTTPAGLSFFEYFSERVLEFKKVTAKLTSDELLEMVHEPIEMSAPTQLSTKTPPATKDEESAPPTEDDSTKKKVTNTPTKAKKPNGTQAKPPLKRQSSRKQQQEEKETTKEAEVVPEDKNEKPEESKTNAEENITEETAPENPTEEARQTENTEPEKETETKEKSPSPVKESEKSPKKVEEKPQKKTEEKVEEVKEKEKEKPDVDEPRAKRTRESKKTEPPSPRSPSKRKQKL
ncbi:PREDICTED: neurofilament heavy polypeptide-like isoform X2 [Papilio polytes]|uniref:neurofilament heavy polypeptide-like isoform X2 n=1 Tax=Papilio polytes TaxID=76194 RepID=UPI0006760C28|nr:PREDICTED: neurofilament heavy polypeptide-like isoform X2 [Papilio polytes]